jgi:hypothetical protein
LLSVSKRTERAVSIRIWQRPIKWVGYFLQSPLLRYFEIYRQLITCETNN